MRASPALTIRIEHHGAWRAGALLLAAASGAVLAAWRISQSDPAPLWSDVVTGVAGAAIAVCAWLSWRVPDAVLRWDRQQWWLACAGGAERAGTLHLAIDLGAWMLLRFDPAGVRRGSRWRHRCWLGAQRRGLEPQWHALRCTVLAPAATPPAAA